MLPVSRSIRSCCGSSTLYSTFRISVSTIDPNGGAVAGTSTPGTGVVFSKDTAATEIYSATSIWTVSRAGLSNPRLVMTIGKFSVVVVSATVRGCVAGGTSNGT